MIIHYLTTALANFRKSPFTTAAKIVTLALGLLAMIAVTGVVAYWRSADSQMTPADRAVIFTTTIDGEDSQITSWPQTSGSLAQFLGEDIPELEAVARVRIMGDVPTAAGQRSAILNGAQADPAFLEIFALPFVAGDPQTALAQPDGIVLSEDAARRLFGDAPALGQRLVLAQERDVIVTGVFGALPEPTHLTAPDDAFDYPFDYLSVWRDGPADTVVDWQGMDPATYGLLPADASLSLAALNQRLARLSAARIPPELGVAIGARQVGEITEMRLDSALFGMAQGPISTTTALFGIGVLILAIACVNYAALAAAEAAARAREIGMRRVLGARGSVIFLQSWIESALCTLAAAALAMALLLAGDPLVNQWTGIGLIAGLSGDLGALAALAAVAFAASLASALFPAFVIGRVRPVEVLRTGRVRGGSRAFTQVLVGVQFALASFLLIAVIVVVQQNAQTRRLALSGLPDPIVILPPLSKSGVVTNTLRQQLQNDPQVVAVTEYGGIPWQESEGGGRISRTPFEDRQAPGTMDVAVVSSGFEYFDVYGQALIAGRAFEFGRDGEAADSATTAVVLDSIAIEQLGIASPQAAVGELVYSGPNPLQVIGVVEPRAHAIRGEGEGGSLYVLGQDNEARPLVRIRQGAVDDALAAIERAWNALSPQEPFSYQFEDDAFEVALRPFDRIGAAFTGMSALAFLISCIGLLGMAAHTTQRRLHEIGVRKTLGARVSGIIALLLTDFAKPVVIANLIAWPAGYLAAQFYVSTFAHPLRLSIWPFALSMLITLAIAWLAVGGQTFKAASVRPAQVLRDA